MAHLLHAARREYQKMGRLIEDRLFTLPGGNDDSLNML
jgi:hypothetical protein